MIHPDATQIRTGLADITFDSEMEVGLGGVTACLLHTDSPHCRDAVLVYVPEDRVLIGGNARDVDYYDNDGKFDPRRPRTFVDFMGPWTLTQCTQPVAWQFWLLQVCMPRVHLRASCPCPLHDAKHQGIQADP